jgi:hypothetical protein
MTHERRDKMGLTAKQKSGGNYDPVSQGLHQAICYGIFDLGTQYNEAFGKSTHKVLITWEIPGERIEIEKDGEKKNLPRAISREYTLSLHKKAGLRKDLESWRGKAFTEEQLEGFDLTKLLAANCMLQVIHNAKDGKTYANVANIVQLPKGMEKKTPENTPRYFAFEEHQDQIPEGTPDWIKDKIKASEEWGHIKGDYAEEEVKKAAFNDGPPMLDEEIPF